MRFSPGCSCCPTGTTNCCTGLPDTLYLALVAVGATACVCLGTGGNYTLTHDPTLAVSPAKGWRYTDLSCGGSHSLDIRLICSPGFGSTINYDLTIDLFVSGDHSCQIINNASATIPCASPFFLDMGDTVGAAADCATRCCSGGDGTANYATEVSE